MFCMKCGTQLPDGSQFCSKCGAVTSGTQMKQRSGRSKTFYVALAISLPILLVMLWPQLTKMTSSSGLPVGLVPATNKLFGGQFVVKAGGYVTNTFSVEAGMQNFRVAGRYQAVGGTGNDIQAVLATEEEFQNWVNGHEAKVFYSTAQTTTGNLNIGPLAPGRYVLAFSNRFSLLTDKNVSAEVAASWLHR
jgi:predicted nucleic acid-binding Zn ribbon protein